MTLSVQNTRKLTTLRGRNDPTFECDASEDWIEHNFKLVARILRDMCRPTAAGSDAQQDGSKRAHAPAA